MVDSNNYVYLLHILHIVKLQKLLTVHQFFFIYVNFYFENCVIIITSCILANYIVSVIILLVVMAGKCH